MASHREEFELEIDQPIRAELFSIERLEQHATSLAQAQKVTTKAVKRRPLPQRLRDNAKSLTESFREIAQAARAGRPIAPAGEWLLDNFHVVQEQVREIQNDLPAKFYNELPKLADGPLAGYPRVYGIAWAIVAHTDSALDLERITRFVDAYQKVDPLTIGELWAIATTLRITLIENLRRLAEATVGRIRLMDRADAIVERVLSLEENESISGILRDVETIPLLPVFVSRVEQRLRDQGAQGAALLHWIGDRLAARDQSADQMVRDAYQLLGATNVSVRNVITSMRLLLDVDWPLFVESVSLVDRILSADSDFEAMEFSTRDSYRRAIERLARTSPLSETAVAQAVIQKTRRAERANRPARECDPGYYLIARGRPAFEQSIGFRPSARGRVRRFVSVAGLTGYLSAIALLTIAFAVIAAWLVKGGVPAPLYLAFAFFLALLPASDLAIALVNRGVTKRLGPASLPAMDLREGIPDNLKTLLVVPTLLTDSDIVEEHLRTLEVHHLSNADRNLRFALLSDWADSDAEEGPADQALLAAARDGVARLNDSYGEGRFLLLHRRRLWNAAQGKWMGWERKRGKLHELNRLLRGARDTSFVLEPATQAQLHQDVRFVITLDADTRLPRGAARKMVGKMAHPLNKPVVDPALSRVVEGHGILQPRVTPSLPSASGGSLFQWAFSGPNGLDPYAFAVSDVYQDLFEEGSYVGKGIYDIDAFEAVLHQRIPENTVLSHDLLEGAFARAALTSDIEVVEEFPSRYEVEVARQHRWMRGDWQLLPWILGLRRADTPHTAPLPALARWKMIDNLRRSLSAPALLLALLCGWLLPEPASWRWTLAVLATIVLPPVLPLFGAIVPHRVGVSRRSHLGNLIRDFALAVTQIGFTLTFLARAAWLSLDAVSRTLFRLTISRKRLLEWVSFAQTRYSAKPGARGLALQLCGSFAFALIAGALVSMQHMPYWPVAAPLLALWALSPAIARLASRIPPAEPHLEISMAQRAELRGVARRTWRFFEVFVDAQNNFLPPDNFQEDPRPVVATRTSPTNIGLYLIAVVAARDFGWIGTLDALARIEATLATMDKLERYRGHFLNWYETRTMHSLDPRYVSSVDSGNLAGHLLVVKNTCLEILEEPFHNWDGLSGIVDAISLLREACAAAAPQRAKTVTAISEALTPLGALLDDFPSDVEQRARRFERIVYQAQTVLAAVDGSAANSAQDETDEIRIWAQALVDCAASHQRDFAFTRAATGETPPQDFIDRLTAIARRTGAMANQMEFGFLYNRDRQLLSIGFRVDEQSLDGNAYDLLASEARLASFFAIAKGDVPTRHWFRLGRTMIPLRRGAVLLSWSGSMFEYLMPTLIMREPADSVLAQTCRLAVARQIAYGHSLNIPWGISESQFNARDREQNYQYSGFGVPDLGIKRGLGENTVISPYSTGLAAMMDPVAALENFARLTKLGARGHFGWYEALDFTRQRLPEGAHFALIRSYMSHHQAMAIVGIADVLNDGRIRERFHAEPMIEATDLLLQERIPREAAVARPPPELNTGAILGDEAAPPVVRRYTSANSIVPRTHLLSNGSLSLMLTAAGSGYTRWRDFAVTRWREDKTRDCWGSFLYLRDTRSGATWSAGYQPCATEPDRYEVIFSEDRASILRTDLALTTLTEVTVSPEDDAEVRRISITNHGSRTREIDVTSYVELALARPADDLAHPAFSKMFVETEYDAAQGILLATRRPRSPGEARIWAAHLAVVEGESVGDVQYDTDRGRFVGRGRTARAPYAVSEGWPLANTAGAVLDPIFSLRRRVLIPRGRTVTVAFWTVVADSREAVIDLADKHRDPPAFTRAMTLAATHAQALMQHQGITANDANLFQLMANGILYAGNAMRAPPEALLRGGRPASTLWPLGISGDLPIVVLRIDDADSMEIARQVLHAHAYWRSKQLTVDLVILNDRAASYAQDLQLALEKLLRMNLDHQTAQQSNVYLVRDDLLNAEVRDLLLTAARLVLSSRQGTLAEQIARAVEEKPAAPRREKAPVPSNFKDEAAPVPELEFANGFGGFASDGREYVTVLEDGQTPPAPWVNVIANRDFGFQVSAEGAGFSWALNSQQNQLTAWSNDPVSNETSEAIYIKDLDTGEIWSPVATPIREAQTRYVARHGQGYSRFACNAHGVSVELLQFVPLGDPIKISRLRIVNRSGKPRRLSVTAYAEWSLGPTRSKGMPFIVSESDPDTGTLLARNPWSDDFGGRIAFLDLLGKQTGWTADRREFLGRNGALDRPAALRCDEPLSGRVGAGLDPCGALQTELRLPVKGEGEVTVLLGQAESRDASLALVARYRTVNLDEAFKTVTDFWDGATGSIQVKTPDRAMDILLNRWLVYQALSCRVWGRAGFYQASGAYGFRDQLQDVMALCVSHPDLAREQIVRAAGRQFPEGDVQHWWLPETGKGIRTRISDDKAWLAHVLSHYLDVTGDESVLDEEIAFLEGQSLSAGEGEAFFNPRRSDRTASLYEHCALALEASLATGVHGLPLMGTGDWNDGMNRVGQGGKGESVWLGWFLYDALSKFIRVAERRGDTARATAWLMHTVSLKEALDQNGWDGDWYRRAYYDDGTPLGSVANQECRIDAIAQSWSVISGAAQPARAARAMEALDKYLVHRGDGVGLLFTPPFVNSDHDPGYIKGYPAGLRENGGQYTHGVLWAVAAFAMLGNGDKAGELFSMINPINHARNRTAAQRYRVEPYVACADVYSVPPLTGRGGWTWYTGSASWMYRVGIEWLLGLRVQGDRLVINPCIPAHWPGFEATLRYRGATYAIKVDNPGRSSRGVALIEYNGETFAGPASSIALAKEGGEHIVRVVLGAPRAPAIQPAAERAAS